MEPDAAPISTSEARQPRIIAGASRSLEERNGIRISPESSIDALFPLNAILNFPSQGPLTLAFCLAIEFGGGALPGPYATTECQGSSLGAERVRSPPGLNQLQETILCT